MSLSAATVEKSASLHIQEWRRLGKLLPWLVLVASLMVTGLLWKGEQENSIYDLQTDFNYRVRDTSSRIEQRMKVYEQMLRGAQGAFAAFSSMGRSEFHTYVYTLNLAKDYPGVQGVGFELVVPAAQKDRHIAAIRKEGFPGYVIRPEGARDIYTPSIYMEPFTELNRSAFGFDNFTDPIRRAAMERARDHDLPIISGKIVADKFNKIKKGQAVFRMYLPVFRNGAPHNTVAERRANIIGWVYARFRMNDLMNGILGEAANEIDIEIHDGEDMSDQSVMYDPDVSGSSAWSNALFHSTNRIEIAGHYWTIAVHSLYGFETRLDREKPNFIAYAGAATSLLLALLTGVLARGRARALQAAREINRELTERKRAEEGVRLASTVFHTMEEGVVVTDPDNKIISVNPAFTTITGYPVGEVIGKNPRILSAGKHPPEFYQAMWASLLATGSWHGEIWDRRKNGECYVKWLSIKAVRDEDGKLTHYVAVFFDISERKAAEEHMQYLAHHDALTGLPNRTLFTDRLQQSLAKAKRDKSHMALMFIDLDKFKPINDTFGHAVGDILLKEVAKRLQHCIMRESDTSARLGGDEFVVLLCSVDDQQNVRLIADKILYALSQPFELAGQSLQISASIGVAIYPEHGDDERQLVKNADIAMYHAKGGGRDNVKLYRPEMQGPSQKNVQA